MRHSLSHRVLLEFVEASELLEQRAAASDSGAEAQPEAFAEMRVEASAQWSARRIELLHSLQQHLLALCHTREVFGFSRNNKYLSKMRDEYSLLQLTCYLLLLGGAARDSCCLARLA